MRNFPKFIFSLNFLYIALIAAQVAAIIFLCLYLPSVLPLAITFVLVWALNAAAAALLFSRKGPPEIKCAWFVFITALPVAGALIYFFASVKKRPCGLLNVVQKGENLQKDGEKTVFEALCKAAGATCGTCAAGFKSAVYFKDGGEFFNAVCDEISKAKKRVFIEFFIFGRGQIFSKALCAIEKALKNGAEVKIIIDGLGSAFRVGRREIKKLRGMGVEVKVFHRITPLPRARLNFRDHRKIITVDGAAAFTGGFNLADEYANINSPYGYWKDTGVAVYGDAAKVFEGMFLSVWRGGCADEACKSAESYQETAENYKNAQKSGLGCNCGTGYNYLTELPAAFGRVCLPFYDSPPHRAFCEDAYAYAINSAKKRVYVTTPYFCVTEKLASALIFAARRGVEVKIILPHIPDKKYAFELSKAYAYELNKAFLGGRKGGNAIEFYEFTPGFMHAKCLICDNLAFLGSYNFDFRSTHFNFECGVAFDGGVCGEVVRDFKECLALSAPLCEGKLRPAKRFYRFILKLFSPLI